MNKIVLCAIAKCENRYITEWIGWHFNIGFDKIVIYDNNDKDGERIRDAVGEIQNVEIVNWIKHKQRCCEAQVSAYNDCYVRYADWNWIMFLDIDEFLEFKNGMSVREYLDLDWVGDANAIKFHWKCYSDNGYTESQPGLVTETYTELCEDRSVNRYTKTMYRCGMPGFRIVNVHYSSPITKIYYQSGKKAPYRSQTTDDNINYGYGWIRHYVTKSLEEFVTIKYKRRGPGSSKTRLDGEFYFKYNKKTPEKARMLKELIDKMEDRIQPARAKPAPAAAKSPEPYYAKKYIPGKPVTPAAKPAPEPAAVEPGGKYPFGISVCISAWKTAEYIEECLDSVAAQTWFKDRDNWEILLGIDGCEETLAKVREIMHKYKNLKVMMMDHNVGTYVTCNTIMQQAKYEWLLRFDSDDVMLPDMVEKFMTKKGIANIVQCYKQDFGIKKDIGISFGVLFIKHSVFEKFNGYKDWICDGDNDLLHRITKYTTSKKISDVLYKRRVHNNSLTINEKTNFNSEIRKQHLLYIRNQFNYNTISKCINDTYKTTSFEIIFNNKDVVADERIIVSFTSWKKRIQYCSHIVDLMTKQTIKPYKIILNLSTDEFVNKESDLPDDLVKKQNGVFEIYWVKENTKAYKKILPTLERFPNDVIVSVDDDIEYPLDLIEKMYNEYKAYGKKLPITSGTYKWKNDIFTHYGCFSLIKKDFVGNYLNDLYQNVVLKNGIDIIPFSDPVITYAVLLNGLQYRMTPYFNMSKIREKSVIDKRNRFSDRGSDAYKRTMNKEHAIIQKYILEKYGKTYDGLFDAPIIVNITTWRKRDWCLSEMLENLKKQTKKPDKVVLWLSEEEYDNDNLPDTIKKCAENGLLTDIMWVEKNTYCHKRFGCFEYFPECYNIFMDDDILYPNDFIYKLYNSAKENQNCISVYSTNSVYYDGYSITKKNSTKEASHYNAFMGGCCCFPPNILPNEVFEKIELRDEYVKKCDESWIRPVLIKHDIKVFSVMTYNRFQYNVIDNSQKDSVYSENKVILDSGIREKERNFFNSIKIHNAENECKKLWPRINIDKWVLMKK